MSRGWIHHLLLIKPGQRLRDEEGRWKIIGDPVPFRGRAAFRSANRADVAAGRGESKLITVQSPHSIATATGGVNPEKGDTVLIEGLLGRDVLLNGEWLVDAVSSSPTHARLLCSHTAPA